MKRRIIQVDEKVPLLQGLPLCLQHLFAMFGASILVPILFGINPSVVLLMNGIATLGYLIICKGQIPAFLGSSFAFIPPVLVVLGTDKALWMHNYHFVLGGFIVAGIVFILFALVVKIFGNGWIKVIFPPTVIGPIIALIGLELANTAAKMAGIISQNDGFYDKKAIVISSITFITAIFGSILWRKFFAVIPILIAIIVGYVVALLMGQVDFTNLKLVNYFIWPTFTKPIFQLNAIILIVPAIFVVISEHMGHFMLTQYMIKRDLVRNPGLHRSFLGNGLFTIISGLFGSVPTTTYGENISVMTITKVYSVWIIGGAAVISIVISFIGKFAAIIQSIPTPVIGGISLFLFGIIAVAGIRVVVEEQVDYQKNANLILSSAILIIGVSGADLQIGTLELKGMSLATFVGIVLSITFYVFDRFKLTNESIR